MTAPPPLDDPLHLIGRTPLVRLRQTSATLGADLYAKLEGYNLTGSVKDRAAVAIIEAALEEGAIGPGSTVVESTSGNFGVALAAVCRRHRLRCICVIDVNTTEANRFLIEQLGAEVELVTEPDRAGGYLASRIARVEAHCRRDPRAFWPNQYANRRNWQAHYDGTAREVCEQLDSRIDFFFAAVSSAGTIMGCARYLREHCAATRVVAVDVEGSVIFGAPPRVRYIPGVGSSRVPEILDPSLLDDVVHVTEEETVLECRRLLQDEALFVGGSSGTVVAAIRRYFAAGSPRTGARPVVAAIFPDRGERYLATIFDDRWVARRYPRLSSGVRAHAALHQAEVSA